MVFFSERTLAAELDYSSLPTFYYSSGTGEWETELTFSGDGSFEGKYYKEESDKTGNGYLLGTRKEADFYGRVGKPEKVGEYEYKIRFEELRTRVEPKTAKIENNKKIIYTTPFGLRKGKELRLYLPGKKTSSLPKNFQTEMKRARGDNKLEMFLLSYGIYSSKDKSAFLGEASKEVREKFKRKEWKIKEDKLLVKVRKETKKKFKNIGYGYQRLTVDSNKEYDFSRSGYRVNIKKGKMRIYDKEGRVQKIEVQHKNSFDTVEKIFVSKKDMIYFSHGNELTPWDEDLIPPHLEIYVFGEKNTKVLAGDSNFQLGINGLKGEIYKGKLLYTLSSPSGWTAQYEDVFFDLKTKKETTYNHAYYKKDYAYFVESADNNMILYKEKIGSGKKKRVGKLKLTKEALKIAKEYGNNLIVEVLKVDDRYAHFYLYGEFDLSFDYMTTKHKAKIIKSPK